MSACSNLASLNVASISVISQNYHFCTFPYRHAQVCNGYLTAMSKEMRGTI
jgi:hypothetical protein